MIIEIRFSENKEDHPLMLLSVHGTFLEFFQDMGGGDDIALEVDYRGTSSLTVDCDLYLIEYSYFLLAQSASGYDVETLVTDLNKLNDFKEWLRDIYYIDKKMSIEDYEDVCNHLLELVDAVCETHGLTYIMMDE